MTGIDRRRRSSDAPDGRADVAAELVARWPAMGPFLLAGSGCVVAGGLVAAVTGPTGFVHGSWTAAFLVLVGGVAQIALGAGQGWLAGRRPLATRVRAELVSWNAAVAGTIVGTLAGAPIITTAAGFTLVPALGLFITTTRGPNEARRTAQGVYRALAGIVLVSIPIGLGLAWSRHR